MKHYRVVRKRWREFCREHREGLEELGYFISGLSIFATIFLFYFLGILFGGM